MAGRHYTPLGYCDKTDIENFLLLDIDSSFNQQIDDWIATAEKQVNLYTGYTTSSGVLREEITGEMAVSHIDEEGNLMIFPRKIPIVSVSKIELWKGTDSLSLDLTDDDGDTKYNIPTTADYILYPSYELSVTGTSLIKDFFDVKFTKFFTKIDYIAGYATVPEPIRQATVNLVADIIMRHANKEGLEAITQGRISKRWFARRGKYSGKSDFVLDAEELMRPYKIASQWL
ncbi:MAG: hypothetical protein ACTSYW_10475 [Candidatus Heimdallarchaeota archaeon]